MLVADHRPPARSAPRVFWPAAVVLGAGLVLLSAGAALTYVTVVEAGRAWRGLPQANRDPRPVRGIPYADAINQAGGRYGVNPALLGALVAAESRFDPRARSARGALGLAQVLPSTWVELRAQVPCAQGPEVEACLYDPETSLRAGGLYLRRLLDRYGGDAVLALAAYNAGAARVDALGAPPPFRETAGYLRRVAQAWYALQRSGTLPRIRYALIVGDDHWARLRSQLLAGGLLLLAVALPWLRRRRRRPRPA